MSKNTSKKHFNNFYCSSFPIMQRISKDIVNNSINSEQDILEKIMLFAIGIEKVLKGIIYDVNPVYILNKPEFNNSVLVSYSEKIKNPPKDKTPIDYDVIALTNTIFRAELFLHTVREHKNVLFKIKDVRDIIAHHHTKNINWDDIKEILFRDFYPILKSLSDEHDLNGILNFFNNQHAQLAQISSKRQLTVEEQIKLRIDASQAKWKQLENNSTFNKDKCKKELINELKFKDFTYATLCPSCSNDAVVYVKEEMQFDQDKLEMKRIGEKVAALKCFYCGFSANEYNELDFLKINLDKHIKDTILSQEINQE